LNVKWDKKQCHQSLISDIQTYFNIGDNGSVSIKNGIEFQIDALFSKVVHSYDLDYDVLYQNFDRAVTSVFKNNPLTKPDEILLKFKTKCDEDLRKKNKYFLLTSISLKNNFILKRRTINGCIVNFYKEIPKKYESARYELIQKHSKLHLTEQNNYVFVSVSVLAPDVKTAFKNSIAALDTIRAILQLGFQKNIQFLSPNKGHKYSSNTVISLGQVHTLHLDSGKKAWGNIWYEPDFKNKNAIKIRDFPLIEKNLTTWINNLNKNPFYDHLLTSLTSYINALDHNEQEFRFMKLWSVIEKLVKSDETRIIIKRVSFFYENRAVTKEVLNSLRQARNINVHAGVKPLNVEMKNFNLCLYIEDLFRFFISNPFKYDDLQKVIDFISLPTELQTIDQQIENLKMVKKFIGEG
jgi:hypothetical protein